MPKKPNNGSRTQIGVRLSSETVDQLAELQLAYAKRAGLILPVSQSEAVAIALREAAERFNIKRKGRY